MKYDRGEMKTRPAAESLPKLPDDVQSIEDREAVDDYFANQTEAKLREERNGRAANQRRLTLASRKAESQPLGRFGRRYEQSLRENRPTLYMEYKKSGELEKHLRLMDGFGHRLFDSAISALLKQAPCPTESIGKAQHMSVLRNQAEEITNEQLLVLDEETEAATLEGYLG
jgi:hypothetical protein